MKGYRTCITANNVFDIVESQNLRSERKEMQVSIGPVCILVNLVQTKPSDTEKSHSVIILCADSNYKGENLN
jgi:hypothetical protein